MFALASLSLRIAAVAGLVLAAGASGPLAQERVGVNSAVNPEATGAPPGAAPRRLVIGQDVVFNEHITTTEGGQTQLLFLDQSSMTIGPNSDLTIDQFVYDPKSGTGKLAMSATRGLLRYVGGKLSKQDQAVTLRTSTATLAVRGGAFIVRIDRTGATEVIFIFGDGLTVTGLNGISETVRRPGFAITVSGPGAAPSPPAPEPPGQLALFTEQLDGRTGGTGGAPVIPTDATVVGSGIQQTISGNVTASVQQAVQNQVGTTTTQSPATTTTSTQTTTTNQLSTATSAGMTIDCVSAGTCPTNTTPVATTTSGQSVGGSNGISGGTTSTTTTSTTPPPVAISFAGRLKKTNDTARGFFDQSTNVSATTNGDVAYAGGTLSFPAGAPQQGVFIATVGNLGTISFPLVPGKASFQGSSSSLGAFTGTSFLSADNTFFQASITPTNQPGQRLFIFGGTPVNASFYKQTGSTRIFAFSVPPDAALQSNIPFVRGQAGGNLPNAAVSPLFVVAPPTTAIGDATTVSAARALQASLAINGQGANQQSAIAVTTGTIDALQSSGLPILNGHLRGSSLLASGGTPVRLGSAVSSTVDGNNNSFYGGNAISGFVVDQTQFNSSSAGIVTTPVIPSTANEIPLSGTAASYGFAQPALPAAVPSGIGASRTTRALSGGFGGLMYTTAQTTPYIATGGTFVSTDAPNNRIQATLSGSAQSPSSGINTLSLQYGGLTGNAGGREAFIDDNTLAVLESQVNPQQINGRTLVVNGDPNQAGKLYLVSSGAAGAPAALLPSGASYCQCQFLQWGYWGGDLRTGNSTDSSISRIDRGHINTWVAGVATPLADLGALQSQSATASYAGHAIGSVFNNGASYLAAGGFNGSYNFGTQTGTMAISNFDGHSFAASGKAPLTGANYTFGLTSPGVKGAINGTFFGPMAAETGGNFAVQTTVGPAYLASGIFAGKR